MAAPGHRRKSRLVSNVVLILFCVLTFIPVWYFLNNAFKEEKYVYQNPLTITPEQFTTDNVVRAFNHLKFGRSFLNSFIFVTTSCALLVFLAALASYAIAVVGGRLLGAIYVGFVLMITLPFGLAMIPLVSLLRDLGLLNTYLGTSLVYTATAIPFAVFLYTGYIRTIPRDFEDAARIDGCGMFRTFASVYLPLLGTVTITLLILRGVAIYNDLLIPLLTISDVFKVPLSLRLYSFATERIIYWELLFAGTFLVSIPVIVAFLFLQRFITSDAIGGAIKG